jgi:FAD/FMN-containing dehydrogenase/Fe-S oxidoreductase
MNDLLNDLQQQIQGEIHFDPMHRRVYSVDASIYEIEPIGIVVPKHKADLLAAIAIAKKHQIPVIARGAATGIAGGCIGKALIIDTSKYLNQIKEINYEQEYVICEPGVVQDKLNAALADRGYRLGPDTSTGNRATLGGMLANNSAGARSLRYGSMVDHVEAVELVLASGDSIYLQSIDEAAWSQKRQQQNAEGHLYRELYRLRNEYSHEIENLFPKIPRRVSGYNLNTLLSDPWNPSQLIAGSEGTLGIATEIRMRICKKPQHLGMCIIHFDSMQQAMKAISSLLKHPLLSLELIDHHILTTGRSSPTMRNKLDWLEGDPQAILIAEVDGATAEDTAEKLSRFESDLQKLHLSTAQVVLTDPVKMNYVWELRKAGLGLLLSKRSYSRAIAFIEDLSVPPKNLTAFMIQLQEYLRSKGKDAGIYGHVGAGCMHIRPYIDLRQDDELHLMQTIMEDVSSLVLVHGGALSGEHGDGLVRSWLNEKMFGPRLYQAFVELKTAFDPENRMNPGKIVHGHRFLEDLRLNPQMKRATIATFLDFSREGGFELAADLCNGNGACRKAEKVMCPSFQATGDEYDTTRARAQALRAVINGHRPVEDFTSPELHDVLDLCLECKGCKTECPSTVDMAKMKSEFLYQYQQKNGVSLRSKLFANIGWFNHLASPFARFANWLGKSRFAKAIQSCLGITPERTLPPLARKRFSQWFKKHIPKPKNRKKVVLYNDTYNEFNHPEIGQSAVAVLEALGYQVVVPKWSCCGRPAISKGLLKEAREMAKAVINSLSPYAHEGISIVGLEPSCLSAIKDDFRGLLGSDWKRDDVDLVIQQCTSFDEFIVAHLENGKLPLTLKTQDREVKLHGHCHQKVLVGTEPTMNVLRAIPGFNVSEIPSGCCGLAGSFGYEKEHYEISMKIGALHLFPAINASKTSTLIVANGISCRSQIAHGTGRSAKHLAEALVDAINFSECS